MGISDLSALRVIHLDERIEDEARRPLYAHAVATGQLSVIVQLVAEMKTWVGALIALAVSLTGGELGEGEIHVLDQKAHLCIEIAEAVLVGCVERIHQLM